MFLFFCCFLASCIVCSFPASCQSSIVAMLLCFYVVIGPTDWGLTTTWPCSLSLGPPRVPLENHRFSDLLPRPWKIRKSEPKVPRKLPKRHPKVYWKSSSSLITGKSETSRKPSYLLCFQHIRWRILVSCVHPNPIKTHLRTDAAN